MVREKIWQLHDVAVGVEETAARGVGHSILQRALTITFYEGVGVDPDNWARSVSESGRMLLTDSARTTIADRVSSLDSSSAAEHPLNSNWIPPDARSEV